MVVGDRVGFQSGPATGALGAPLGIITAEIRLACRQLLRSPGILFITILTLALGIGANTAVFTLTWNIVLSSLPVPHPDELVQYQMRKGDTLIGLSGPEYRILRDRQRSCTDLLSFSSDRLPVRVGAQTELLPVQFLSENTFDVLDLHPDIGDFFDEQRSADEGIPAMLSYHYWQTHFAGDRSAIGKSIIVGNHPATIIGIMPQSFAGLTANLHPEVYLPLSFLGLEYGRDYLTGFGHFNRFVLGRLKRGATLSEAQAELRTLALSVRREADPSGIYLNQSLKDFQLLASSGRSGVNWVQMNYERTLLVLEALVVFVLVLCCTNIALVMLARISGRQQEYALRVALGCSRGRLVRHVFIETVLLTGPGLVAGVFIGWPTAHLLVNILGNRGNLSSVDLRPNGVIIGVNLAAALLVAIGAGLWPALRAAWTQPSLDLKAGSQTLTARYVGRWAISLQVAVSVTLVSTALATGGMLTGLLTTHSGFRSPGVVIADLHLADAKLGTAEEIAHLNRFLDAVEEQPGVTAAGYIDVAPLRGYSLGANRMFSVDRHHVVHSDPSLAYLKATPGYFEAAGTGVVAGQSNAAPPDSIPACVLSRTLANFFFPHQRALDELVYASNWPKPDGTDLDPKNACRVTAIVEDAQFVSLRQRAPAILYEIERPGSEKPQHAPPDILIVRARSTALAMTAVKDAAAKAALSDTDLSAETFDQVVKQDLSREMVLCNLSTAFAVLALLLVALGHYGLFTRAATLRMRELGIRLALGSGRVAILKTLSLPIAVAVGAGLAAGMVMTGTVTRAISRILQTPPPGPATLIGAAAVVLLIAAAAVLSPARKALRLSPSRLLRSE
jgi:predicted permease